MKTEEVSFQLIALAGDALGLLFEANEKSLEGEYEVAEKLYAQAHTIMNKAHNEQTKLMAAEAQGETLDVNVLLVHAQDTLMNTVLAESFTKQLMKLNQRINVLEEKIAKK